jgi:hypothetical protein
LGHKGRILTLPPGKAAPGYSFLNLQGYDGKPAGLPYQSGAVSGCARAQAKNPKNIRQGNFTVLKHTGETPVPLAN